MFSLKYLALWHWSWLVSPCHCLHPCLRPLHCVSRQILLSYIVIHSINGQHFREGLQTIRGVQIIYLAQKCHFQTWIWILFNFASRYQVCPSFRRWCTCLQSYIQLRFEYYLIWIVGLHLCLLIEVLMMSNVILWQFRMTEEHVSKPVKNT